MRVYANHCKNFIEDSELNQLTEKMRAGFVTCYGSEPGPSEVQSWRNSLRALAQAVTRAGLPDAGVLLEYKLPLTSKRVDCLICGYDAAGMPAAVVVELKQWETCKPCDGEHEVVSFIR